MSIDTYIHRVHIMLYSVPDAAGKFFPSARLIPSADMSSYVCMPRNMGGYREGWGGDIWGGEGQLAHRLIGDGHWHGRRDISIYLASMRLQL